jgi:hypothetical protein
MDVSRVCCGECLVPQYTPYNSDEEVGDVDNEEVDAVDEEVTYVSVNCPNSQPCTLQPCANFPLCGNKNPQWLLNCKGGLCVQPCDMMSGRIFEFFNFEAGDECPVCFEKGGISIMYQCRHMVCAKCYGTTAWDGEDKTMSRCPICRNEGVPLGRPRRS